MAPGRKGFQGVQGRFNFLTIVLPSRFRGIAENPGNDIAFVPITATCPNRFLENGTIIWHIGKILLGTEKPLFAKEIAFLMRSKTELAGEAEAEEAEEEASQEETGEEAAAAESGREDGDRIDLVFVHPANKEKWCAVEMQAVYFSGGAMSADMTAIKPILGTAFQRPARRVPQTSVPAAPNV